MAQYVLLLTLDADGRAAMTADANSLAKAAAACERPAVQCLGLYGVLGRFDFVAILDAPDNDDAARFSLELGHRAGAQVETLPAVPISLLQGISDTAPEVEPEPEESPNLN
jgi:uncharacterized protein with GYD domain